LNGTQKSLGRSKNLDEVRFGSAILIGAWVFSVTARPRFKKSSAQRQQPLPKDCILGLTEFEPESWSFEPESNNCTAIEQGDRWVMVCNPRVGLVLFVCVSGS